MALILKDRHTQTHNTYAQHVHTTHIHTCECTHTTLHTHTLHTHTHTHTHTHSYYLLLKTPNLPYKQTPIGKRGKLLFNRKNETEVIHGLYIHQLNILVQHVQCSHQQKPSNSICLLNNTSNPTTLATHNTSYTVNVSLVSYVTVYIPYYCCNYQA